MAKITEEQRILTLVRRFGAIRARDLESHGLSRQALLRLQRRGILDRPARGLYVLADFETGEHHSLVEAAKLVPAGVICLLSALRFHNLTTQEPFEIWVAVGNKAWAPRPRAPALRLMRFSEHSLTFGVEEHRIEGVAVRIYSPAKTIADCFKFRNKIGLDVAIEALQDCRRQRKATMDQIWNAAKVCRMANVMRPYMESLA